TDAQSAATMDLSKVNSEVTQVETQIRFIAETRQRIEAQLGQAGMQRETGERRRDELTEAQQLWIGRNGEAQARVEGTAARVADESARLPEIEQAAAEARTGLDAQRRQLVDADRAAQLENTHIEHAARNLAGLSAREERLAGERAELVTPDTS